MFVRTGLPFWRGETRIALGPLGRMMAWGVGWVTLGLGWFDVVFGVEVVVVELPSTAAARARKSASSPKSSMIEIVK